MYAEERQQEILRIARADGRVDVAALADELNVTPETIRRDLTMLERAGVLRRVHGGAIPVERIGFEPALAARDAVLIDEKERIAKAALAEVPDEGAIILDAGTTTARLAAGSARRPGADRRGQLAGHRHDARHPRQPQRAAARRPGPRARRWRPSTTGRCARSPTCTSTSRSSAPTACSVERGLTTPDPAEAAVKRAMIARGPPHRAARRPHEDRQRLPGPVRHARRPRPAHHRHRRSTTSWSPTSRPPACGWSGHDRHGHAQPQPRPADRGRRAGPRRGRSGPPSAHLDPGGKGVNVSRALLANGVASARGGARAAATRAASSSGCSRPRASTCVAVPIAGRTRSNITLAEPDGTVTKINEPGPPLCRGRVRRGRPTRCSPRPAAPTGWWPAAALPPGRAGRGVTPSCAGGCVAGRRPARRRHQRAGAARRRARPARPWSSPTARSWPRSSGGRSTRRRRRRRRRAASCAPGAPARCWPASAPTAPSWSTPTASSPATAPVDRPRSSVGAGDALLAGFLAAGAHGGPRRARRGARLGRRRGQPARQPHARPGRPPARRRPHPPPARPEPAAARRLSCASGTPPLRRRRPPMATPYTPAGPGHRVQGHRPALRRLPRRHGHAQHRRVHRLGPDHRAVHPDRLAAEREARRAGRPDDHLPAAGPDRLHRRPAWCTASAARWSARSPRSASSSARDVPMFLGAMIIGPLAAYMLKLFDGLIEDRIRPGFEMLVDNFSAGIIGGAHGAARRVWAIGPVVERLTDARRRRRRAGWSTTTCCRWRRSSSSRPRCCSSTTRSTTACSARSASPRSAENGKSILFMIESNPGPGLGLLLALPALRPARAAPDASRPR